MTIFTHHQEKTKMQCNNPTKNAIKAELTFEESTNKPKEIKNSTILDNVEWGHYGEYELVGHEKQTNENCGRFVSFKG
ncbi:hypothetical protein E4G67_02590 [Candidatus Bathyarchaeota archaeon]|nr:MAG: hypothetical protein E4G67_02590 [Candidatus Bathyarchaeota archaeon]